MMMMIADDGDDDIDDDIVDYRIFFKPSYIK